MGGSNSDVNANMETYVAWTWKANGGQGSSNLMAITASTVSANTTAGFSMFQFTGTNGNTTVGHGLGGVPKMFIIKNTAQAGHWIVYHKDLQSPAGKQMYLNLTNAQASDTGWLQNTAPSSSVIYFGTNADSNGSGNLCWLLLCRYKRLFKIRNLHRKWNYRWNICLHWI